MSLFCDASRVSSNSRGSGLGKSNSRAVRRKIGRVYRVRVPVETWSRLTSSAELSFDRRRSRAACPGKTTSRLITGFLTGAMRSRCSPLQLLDRYSRIQTVSKLPTRLFSCADKIYVDVSRGNLDSGELIQTRSL